MSHPVISIGRHSTIYRGFTITKRPRSPHQPRNLYIIFHDGHYFGSEYAGAEAMRFIDRLHAERGGLEQESGK